MSTAWDGANLQHNLDVLANLSKARAGAKLSYNSGTGRFTIQEPGFGQKLARTFSSDSVESAEYFVNPVRGLLREARAKVSQEKFAAALAGLRALQGAYMGTSSRQRRKFARLKAVINEFENPVGEGKAVIKFRRKYQPYLIYGMSMSAVLSRTDVGICQAFVINWARRILNGKLSYAVSKHRSKEYEPAASLPPDQQERLAGKVNNLRSAQEILDQYNDMNQALRVIGRKYAGVYLTQVAAKEFQENDDPGGSEVFQEVIEKCGREDSRPVMLALNGKPKANEAGQLICEGHAIGLHLGRHGHHIFDPNVGEFTFSPGSEGVEEEFYDELWNDLYVDKFRGYQVLYIRKK